MTTESSSESTICPNYQPQPHVELVDGKVIVVPLNVVAILAKRHKNILRSIKILKLQLTQLAGFLEGQPKLRQSNANAWACSALSEEIKSVLVGNIEKLGLNPKAATFIPNPVVTQWFRAAMPERIGKGRFVPCQLRRLGKENVIPEIHPETVRYPSTDNGAPRGIGWCWNERKGFFQQTQVVSHQVEAAHE